MEGVPGDEERLHNTRGCLRPCNAEIRTWLGGIAGETAGLLSYLVVKAPDIDGALMYAKIIDDLISVPRNWKSCYQVDPFRLREIPDHLRRYLLYQLDLLTDRFIARREDLVTLADALEARKRLTWQEAVAIVKGRVEVVQP